LVPVEDNHDLCVSCRLNHIIPNLSDETNRIFWNRIEVAKRRLIYSLIRLGLSFEGRAENPDSGLAFKFMEDTRQNLEFSDSSNGGQPVLTGHARGVITINIAEADHSAREEMREKMNEAYRTLLGHFRHEIGHYYWGKLVASDAVLLDKFREIFGDERVDYDAALRNYYSHGPPADWPSYFISAYAASHPWEDWAETWANYLHIIDTLETAHHHGFFVQDTQLVTPHMDSASILNTQFDLLLEDWRKLAITLNEMNRAMGLPDAYPFSLSDSSGVKLRFVHQIIHQP
jgi:hypothetical protein